MFDSKMQSLSVNVLISCMHEKNASIIKRTNIQTDVVVVNQCDDESVSEFDFTNKFGHTCHAKVINTTERGLSRSRNMAIKNAWGDICLICDDDEELEDNYAEVITNAYKRNPTKHVVLFMVERKDIPGGKKYPQKECDVGIRQILQSSSVQITFRRKSISDRIKFDPNLGSGTGNGGGEENKFLLDIKKQHLKIYYVPKLIGTVMTADSLWFHGFTKQYMINRGWSSRRSLGFFIGMLYIISFAIRHRSLYIGEMSSVKAYKYLLKGFFEDRNTL